MKSLIKKFLAEESGATMVEYGIMVALIAAVAIGVVFLLGGYVKGTFKSTNTCLASPTAGNCP